MAGRGSYKFNADYRFKDLYQGGYRYYGYYGGRASGKSYAVADYAIFAAMTAKENILTVREFGNALENSSHKLYVDRIDALGLRRYFDVSARSIYCNKTGSTFSFMGLERNPDKIRSFHDATLTILEEAQNISEYVFRVLLETILRSKKARIVCIWNPIYSSDAVDFFFRGGELPADAICHKVNFDTNIYFKDTGLQTLMETGKNRDYNKYRHVWEGEYYSVMDAVILKNVEFVEPHSIDTTGLQPIYGVDLGCTDPNAFVRAYVLPENKIYIDLAFKQRCSLMKFINYVKENVISRFDTVVCDSAWGQSIEMMHNIGIRVIPASKGPNSVLQGLDWLQDHDILLHPRASMFMEEAKNYTWKIDRRRVNPDGTPAIKQEPIDEYNHLIDALRYATESYRKPQERVLFATLPS